METAIVMPLNVFLILGIIQLGLISQARYMAKYAAYRAVRVGAMNHADPKLMKQAAVAALLPVISMPGLSGGIDVIEPTTSISTIGKKVADYELHQNLYLNIPMISVVTCGPLKSDVSNLNQQRLNGVGSRDEVDFDDPRVTDDNPSTLGPKNLKKFLSSKLRVQVQFFYRMPIPFANWVISHMYLGLDLPASLRMGRGSSFALRHLEMYGAFRRNIYVIPIFESYSMRMQSNFYTGKDRLPTKDNCISWAHQFTK